MKTVLTLAAVSALTFAAMDADAQTRRRGAARAAEPAPAPAPYRLVGPGASQTPSGEPATAAGAAAAARTPEGAATPPTARAEPATAAPAGAPASPETQAVTQPASPTGAASEGASAEGQAEAGESADAGPATPERERAQTALSSVLTQLASGDVDYTKMNTETAARVRAQQPTLTPTLTQYGAVRTIAPLGERGGSQRFRVTFANGEVVFVIATDAQGVITALGVES